MKMHANLITIHYFAVVNTRMCKQILLDLEHGFIHKAKEACHIKIIDSSFGLWSILSHSRLLIVNKDTL